MDARVSCTGYVYFGLVYTKRVQSVDANGIGEHHLIAYLFLEIGDEVVAILVLLQAGEGHFSARDVFLGVLQVLKHGVLVPGDGLLHVSLSV
jgi:hypothetical protein